MSASAGNGWPHNALRTAPLAHANQLPLPRLESAAGQSLTHVSGATASVQTFIFYLYMFHTILYSFIKIHCMVTEMSNFK